MFIGLIEFSQEQNSRVKSFIRKGKRVKAFIRKNKTTIRNLGMAALAIPLAGIGLRQLSKKPSVYRENIYSFDQMFKDLKNHQHKPVKVNTAKPVKGNQVKPFSSPDRIDVEYKKTRPYNEIKTFQRRKNK